MENPDIQSIQSAVKELFPTLLKLNHYFSEKKAKELSFEFGTDEQTYSKYENGEATPRFESAFAMLVRYRDSFAQIADYCQGKRITWPEFQKRLGLKDKDDALVLIAPFVSNPKQEWHMRNHRFLLPVPDRQVLPPRMQYKLSKQAAYVLIFRSKDIRVARMYRVDPHYPTDEQLVEGKELRKAIDPYPGANSKYYYDFHLVPDEYYDVWDTDWHLLYERKLYANSTPTVTYLSELFGISHKTLPSAIPSEDTPDLTLAHRAADEGEEL